MSLDSIVSVQISRETSVPTRTGFGTGAFVSEDAVFEPFIKSYASLTEVASDSLAGAETVKAATLYFSQEIRPEKLYVIKKGADLPHIQVITFAGEFVTANSIDIDVDGATVNTPFDTDSDTTLANIASNLAGEAAVGTAVEDTAANTITVTGAVVNDNVLIENILVSGGASQTTGSVATTQYQDETQTYVESITRAQNLSGGDDWYALAIQSKDKAEQEPVSDYIQALTKLFFLSTNEAAAKDAGDATDIGSLLQAKTNDRTAGLFSEDAAADHPELGLMGGQLPKDPGSLTWAFKTISGVPVDDLTTTELSALRGKNYVTYTTQGGLNITQDGKTLGGEFIDVMRGVDFIQVRMQEAVFALLANEQKVPFTDPGIASVENEMIAVLDVAEGQGILAADPKYTTTVPKAADVSIVDKGNRTLPDMKFEGTLAGAIHKVTIQGVVSL